MAIEFLGHSPSFQRWVFKIDGKQFIGRNFSSASPLAIKFIGMYPDNSPISTGLIKTSGFDILSGTSQSVAGGIGGIVEWVWSGKKYRNTYHFNIGDVAEDEESTLQFAQPIPYDGPVGGPLAPPTGQTLPPVGSPSSGSYPGPSGTGTTPPVAQQPTAADNQLIEQLRRELAEVNRSLAVSENQRMIDTGELNKARANAQTLQANLSDARAELSQAGLAQLAALQAQLNDSVQRVQEQYKTAAKDQALINDLTRDLAQAKASLKAAEESGAINVAQLNQARASANGALAALEDAKAALSSGYNTMLLKLQGEIADALVRVQTNYQRALKAEEEKARIAADLARTQGERDEANRKLAEQQRLADERRKAEADTEALKKASDTVKTEAAKGQGSIVPVVLGIAYLLLS